MTMEEVFGILDRHSRDGEPRSGKAKDLDKEKQRKNKQDNSTLRSKGKEEQRFGLDGKEKSTPKGRKQFFVKSLILAQDERWRRA